MNAENADSSFALGDEPFLPTIVERTAFGLSFRSKIEQQADFIGCCFQVIQ